MIDKSYFQLNHMGGTVINHLVNGQLCVVGNGKNRYYTVAKNSTLYKHVGFFNPDEYCLLYTPEYVCVIDINAKILSIIQNEDFNRRWNLEVFSECQKFAQKGYESLLIPLPLKIGETNKCYILDGGVAISKKEYNALCRANTKIKAHFSKLKTEFSKTLLSK